MSERPGEGSGRAGGEARTARSTGSAVAADRGGDGWRAEPALLGGARPARQPEPPAPRDAEPRTNFPTAPRSTPKGWPAKEAGAVWAWMAKPRPPLTVLVAGAEGGVGTTTVAALLGETIAAASPGSTWLLDQCGSPWGSLTRRLTDQRRALTAAEVAGKLRAGTPAEQIISAATTTSAGAVLLSDPERYTSLRELGRLTHVLGGAGVIDAGRADLILVARLADVESVPILVGRADVIGAEAVCAALGFLQRQGLPVQPVVVLSSTTPTDRRRVHAAVKLVATAGVIHLVHLSHDAQLATGRPVRLDQVSKTTAAACLRLATHIAQTQEVLGYVSRRP